MPHLGNTTKVVEAMAQCNMSGLGRYHCCLHYALLHHALLPIISHIWCLRCHAFLDAPQHEQKQVTQPAAYFARPHMSHPTQLATGVGATQIILLLHVMLLPPAQLGGRCPPPLLTCCGSPPDPPSRCVAPQVQWLHVSGVALRSHQKGVRRVGQRNPIVSRWLTHLGMVFPFPQTEVAPN